MHTLEQVKDYIKTLSNLELCYFDVGNRVNGSNEAKKTDHVQRIPLQEGTWYLWFRG